MFLTGIQIIDFSKSKQLEDLLQFARRVQGTFEPTEISLLEFII
jgi:hypothetical protein